MGGEIIRGERREGERRRGEKRGGERTKGEWRVELIRYATVSNTL